MSKWRWQLVKEIKSLRRSKPKVAESIDGVHNNLPDHFGSIYKELYNSVNDGEEVKLINQEVESKLKAKHLEDIDNVTAEEVKKAASKLKPGKSDPLSSFSSSHMSSVILLTFVFPGNQCLDQEIIYLDQSLPLLLFCSL